MTSPRRSIVTPRCCERTPGQPRGGLGVGVAGRRATPSATASPSSWSRSTGARAISASWSPRWKPSSKPRRPRPSACASCARWPRFISASAGPSGRSSAAAAAWLADVESGETLAEMEALGLAGGTARRAGGHAREGGRRGRRSEPAGAAVGDDRAAAGGSAGPRRRRDRGLAVGAGGPSRRSGRLPGPRAAAVRRGPLRRSWSTCWRSTSRSPPTPASARRWPSASRCCTKTRSSSASRRCAPGRRSSRSMRRDGDALESLAQLHLRAGAFRELADVYARKLELATRPEERRMLFAQSARIFEEKLAEPEQAIGSCASCWRRRRATPRRCRRLDRILTSRRAARGPRRGARRPGRVREDRRKSATSSRSGRRASPRPSCGDVEAAISRYQGILAAHARSPRRRARRCARSRTATTTACRRSRCWSRSCARARLGAGRLSSASCGWRSRTR